jgi:XTP/dITP diphosphohydrolase
MAETIPTPKKKIYFITGNSHKFSEISDLFQRFLPDYELLQLKEDLLEIQAWTLEEVAEFKLKNVKSQPKYPYFIEDAGFFVDNLKGFPGVYSAYIFKSIGYDGILKIMSGRTDRNAHFKSVIAYMDPAIGLKLFVGKVEGVVSEKAKGTNGFGFDPIFIPNEIPDKTFAELSMEEKNRISHRSRSFQRFIEYLSAAK